MIRRPVTYRRQSTDTCIFCGRDPYEYVDIGVGMERVAVSCCDPGIGLLQYRDPRLSRVAELYYSRDPRKARRGARLVRLESTRGQR